MTAVQKTTYKTINPDDPNVRDPEHAHELGGTLGMTVGGVIGGIATGVVTGATVGGVAGGPIGVVVGAAIGGALGGKAGEEVARDVNPTAEEQYWKDNYHTRPYIAKGETYETYRPAYRSGIEGYRTSSLDTFEDLEPSLRNDWGIKRGSSKLEWDEARHAARDAFIRLSDNDKR